MYTPKAFSHPQHALALMRQNPLATVISHTNGAPFISHLPLIIEEENNDLIAYGHLARANPHWQCMQQNPKLYLIFHGPNAYISPTWYEKNDVPTWNYCVVHAEAEAELLENPEVVKTCLQKLNDYMNQNPNPTWEFWIPPDLEGKKLTAIVGFKAKLKNIQTKLKLSQNRSPEDQKLVQKALAQQPGTLPLSNWMKLLQGSK